MKMNLIMLGPPGAGKGTQAEMISEKLTLPHVASGDLFRDHLNRETELGLLAKTHMNKGQLVPDEITISMVQDRLRQTDCDNGVVLDGFPRTLPQAEGLSKILDDLSRKITAVLYIAVPDEVLVERLSGRRICRDCQAPFHIEYKPAKKDGICDHCGGELYQRDDDNPETVRARLRVYHEETAPLCTYYGDRDLLTQIEGSGDINTVKENALDILGQFGSTS
jgi:adenylate kinase